MIVITSKIEVEKATAAMEVIKDLAGRGYAVEAKEVTDGGERMVSLDELTAMAKEDAEFTDGQVAKPE